MSKPIAVLISDIHFNIKNLELASVSLKSAITKSENLNVPLIIAGDLNDTKAIIRGEVANQLIKLISSANTEVFIVVGNHDLINEKGLEHTLNFLKPYATIVDKPTLLIPNVVAMPYNQINLTFIDELLSDTILITHQGYQGAYMGDYVQDKTSLSPSLFSHLKVFSGHYHRHQTIGTVTYIGSPYTMSFGEANDGPKGFLIVNDDGTYKQEVLNLRKHVKIILRTNELSEFDFKSKLSPKDLIWFTIVGSKKDIEKVELNDILDNYNYKLEFLIEDEPETINTIKNENLTDQEKFDMFIEEQKLTHEEIDKLKKLWRTLL